MFAYVVRAPQRVVGGAVGCRSEYGRIDLRQGDVLFLPAVLAEDADAVSGTTQFGQMRQQDADLLVTVTMQDNEVFA